MGGYDPTRRSARRHHRVTREGSERFDVDEADLGLTGVEESGVEGSKDARSRDDDARILRELPPHWGIFSERGA
ncbi:hypothetical protein PT282_01795 [Bifidobacterium sp. ESL0763]|uniref:hypothetical protein n=1 Tax=Bifidobacterium sp. ESL0763 TaxID=2983227 RepID=UPI0023F78DD2|nr:hypothetical protein [Bifidobacterium sp. ESL0763]MDF7663415.1 hypothetical protein [Bifidobacterium sp. ESL0763]